MNSEVRLIVAVACVGAFVMLDADRIAQWISAQLSKLSPAPMTEIEQKRRAWAGSPNGHVALPQHRKDSHS